MGNNIQIQESNYTITIPENVEDKIRFLCNKIPDVEWSGILFYTYEGSFKDNNLNIICKDIHLMDIGTAITTCYEVDVTIAGFMADHNLTDHKLGLIHSHNRMKTFFSGTDLSTLYNEGKDMHNFVSLIVNNEGTYTAAVTQKIGKSVQNIKLSYNCFGDGVVEENTEIIKEEEEIKAYSLKIVVEGNQFEELENRIKELKSAKKLKADKITIQVPDTKHKYNQYSNSYLDYKPNNSVKIQEEVNPLEQVYFEEENLFTPIQQELDPIDDIVDENIVQRTLIQIVSGDVFATIDKGFDLSKLIESMNGLWMERFNSDDLDESLKKFEYWMDSHIDYVMYETDTVHHSDEWYNSLASSLIEKLNPYLSNFYVNSIIQLLSNYIYVTK